jgi:hypothetical protein
MYRWIASFALGLVLEANFRGDGKNVNSVIYSKSNFLEVCPSLPVTDFNDHLSVILSWTDDKAKTKQ